MDETTNTAEDEAEETTAPPPPMRAQNTRMQKTVNLARENPGKWYRFKMKNQVTGSYYRNRGFQVTQRKLLDGVIWVYVQYPLAAQAPKEEQHG